MQHVVVPDGVSRQQHKMGFTAAVLTRNRRDMRQVRKMDVLRR